MKMNRIDRFGLDFSVLGLGTLTMGPHQLNLPVEKGAEIILSAVSEGINVLDTADLYDTYPYIGMALEKIGCKDAERIHILSRSYDYTHDGMKKSVDRALRELNVSRLACFMLHEMESEHTLRGHSPALDCLTDLKNKGIIRMAGISTHYIRGVRAGLEDPRVDAIFAILNKSGIGIVDGDRYEMESALTEAGNRGKTIFIMKALGGGHLFREPVESLNYALNLPFAHSVIVGMGNLDEVAFNVSVAEGGVLSESKNRGRRLFIEEYCRACGECARACPFSAIKIINGRAVVDPAICMLCSYCVRACPDFCIKIVESRV